MLPHELHLQQLLQTVPALRYTGGMPNVKLPAGGLTFERWQRAAREKLAALLGMDTFRPCEPWFEAQPAQDMGTYLRTRFSFKSEDGYRVPCYWLEPKCGLRPKALPEGPVYGPRPVMICLQGHTTGMHISIGEAKHPGDAEKIEGGRDYAVQAAARGMCALVLEQRGFGECGSTPAGDPDCYRAAMSAQLLGRTLLAGRVWDVMRAIDMAQEHFTRAFGDAAEFYCMGDSGGGVATMYIACLEPRVVKAMPVCAVCGFDYSIAAFAHCACNYVPGIRRWFDMGDLAGMIAPRPLMVVAGEKDSIFPIVPTQDTFALIRTYYEAAGAPQNRALHMGSEGHQFYKEAWDGFLELGA